MENPARIPRFEEEAGEGSGTHRSGRIGELLPPPPHTRGTVIVSHVPYREVLGNEVAVARVLVSAIS